VPSGGLALRFDIVDFVAYDVFILERPDACHDYPADLLASAEARASALSPDQVQRLEATIIAGLPGAEDSHSRAGIAAVIARYRDMGPDDLRARLREFHETVVTVAREHGLRLCIHPDDPPFSLFGLPRVVSTPRDLDAIFGAVPERENGLTFCTGSFGARADNPLPEMLSAWADRVHFVHLRNVSTDPDGSFVEDDHLTGNADMVRILAILLREEARRREEGRADHLIPFRPDHGHLLLDDQDKRTNPGYSAIGRLKGLAELRGILQTLTHPEFGVLR
jgi:mannonate dehydratase